MRLGGDSFAWALCGQALIAVGQPVVMSAVSKLAGEYLPAHERALGISIASAGGFVGMLAALLMGPALGAGKLGLLLGIQAALAALAALALAITLRRRGVDSGERAAIEKGVARALWSQPTIRTISLLAFLGFGVFVALSTWLQTLLHPSGVSETVAGVLLVGMIISGIVGCVALPPLVARRHAEVAFMRATVLVGAIGSVGLGAMPWLGARAAILLVMGAFLLPSLPVILTIAERRAGSAAGTAGAIVWLAGNLGGLAVALVVQALVHHQLAAFLTMAALVALGLPVVGRMPAADPDPWPPERRADRDEARGGPAPSATAPRARSQPFAR